ncbi:MAG: AAA family ATPase [Candidatus Lokiarchaeota archaeon]|nr:AAA family ATPase [Candidatus Lokiarchaeota archaeon]
MIYIKKVILENFLSFQKDEVEFSGDVLEVDPRLILIIGPNWSGKTSIFQAIKFVLGSNERDDRYKKWSDFIHNGQKHAMVELHLQYKDEIIKLRRIVIRGKSPYFEIQKDSDDSFKKISVVDIQEFISQLNINPDNHFAFVSQGKIDVIKNLKPIELCSFLEEGIGLKGLRIEILNQKQKVVGLSNDFQALKSRKNALNFNLDFLMPKLKRLEIKKSLLVIKKQYDDELLWANREILLKIIKDIEIKLNEINSRVKELNNKVDLNNETVEQKRKIILELESQLSDNSKLIGELNYKKKDILNKIEIWKSEKLTRKSELDSLKKEILKKEYESKDYKLQEKNIHDAIAILKTEKIVLKENINQLITEQNDLTKKIKENEIFFKKHEKLLEEQNEHFRKIETKDKEIDDLNHDINDIFLSLQDIENKFKDNPWFIENPSQDLIRKMDEDLSIVSQEIFDIESNLKKNEFEKSKLVKKFNTLKESLEKRKIILPMNIILLKEEIEKQKLKVKGPIIEYLKYDDDLSYAIESVLGERLLYSFVADNWETLNILKQLKKRLNAYCNIYLSKNVTITPLRKFSAPGVIGYLADLINISDDDLDIKKVIYSKISNCIVIQEYSNSKDIYENTGFKGKCVTLKGEQIVSYRYTYETPFMKRLKGFLSTSTLKEQVDVIGGEIETLNGFISDKKDSLLSREKIQRELYEKKELFNDLLYNFNQKERLNQKRNRFYEMIYDFEHQKSISAEKIKELNEQINILESQIEPEFIEWNNRIKEIPLILKECNEKLNDLDIIQEEKNIILNNLKSKSLSINSYISDLKERYSKRKEDFEKADKYSFDMFKNLESIEEEIKISYSEEQQLKENKRRNNADISNLQSEQNSLKLNLGQENFRLQEIKQNFKKKKLDLERINAEIQPSIRENDIEVRSIEKINEDIYNIQKELMKYADVDESLLIEKERLLSSLKEINRNQNSLEKDIKAAMKTEAGMENTYYTKFKGMLSDLESKINNKFIITGIKSYCSLELNGNFEDLGIIIKAAVSKDQLKSCTALSGGQISMVSICLMLSLQEIKPSPLCMFDEAAMFLDDKNAEISYELIKTTLENLPIQLIMFLPKSSNALFSLADKIIGVARVGNKELSTIFHPKIIMTD